LELREPRLDRLRRILVIGLAVMAAAGAAALYLRLADRRGVPSCAQAYAAARTAADTQGVDLQRADPEPGRIEAAYAVTCGELRQRGQLH
jgi:hypothetical protein